MRELGVRTNLPQVAAESGAARGVVYFCANCEPHHTLEEPDYRVMSTGKAMRSAILVGMLLCSMSSAQAAAIVCRGTISQEWGYLTITNEDGVECVITRRVGMQTVIEICGGKRCKVTGIASNQRDVSQYIDDSQYIEGLIAVEIDTLQWGAPEPKRLGDPTLSEKNSNAPATARLIQASLPTLR